jgi:hypothetical protein
MALPNKKRTEEPTPSLPFIPTTPEETRRLFDEIVKREGGPTVVALRLGCSVDTVEKIIDGSRGVSLQRARVLQEFWGIKMEWWTEKPTIEMVPRVVGD